MKEKREFNMLENADDRTIELLSGVPVLTNEEKKRMLAMSKKKLDKMNRDNNISMNNEGIEVSGVERYNRPKWQTFASVAACFVLLGGIGGTMFALSKGSRKNSDSTYASTVQTTTSAAAVTVATTSKPEEITTESAATELTNEELVKIVTEGIRNFTYADETLAGSNVSVDKNDKITKQQHAVRDEGTVNMEYYRAVDSRFETMNDFESYIGEYLADPLLTLRLSDNTFVEYNGKLYVYQPQSIPARTVEFINDPILIAYDGTYLCAATTTKYSTSEDEMNVQIELALVDDKWKVCGYQESFNTDAETDSPNADLAIDILKDLRVLDQLGAGCGVEVEEDISETIVTDEGYEYVYYKVADDFASENFKNSIEDIKSWVDGVVTGEAYERFKWICDEKDAMFREFDGELYYMYGLSETYYHWFGEPQIKNVQNGSFDILVKSFCTDSMVMDLTVNVVKGGYGWKINKCVMDESTLRPATEEEILGYENNMY